MWPRLVDRVWASVCKNLRVYKQKPNDQRKAAKVPSRREKTTASLLLCGFALKI